MHKHKTALLLIIILSTYRLSAQEPIQVTDLSFIMNGNDTKEFYYSFAKGDVMVVDFGLNKGKGITFEIIELPSHTKANLFTANLTNYRISVPSTNVYLFKITNGNGKKTCSLHLKRIPKSKETMSFNTGWQWKTIYDTSYTRYQEDSLVRHDTVHYTETVKEIASKKISEIELVERIEQVHSEGIIIYDNPRSCIKIELPENQKNGNFENQVTGWAYWIGVTSKNSKIIGKLLKSGSSLIPDMSLLTNYLLGKIVDLAIPEGTDNVQWYIVNNSYDANNFISGKTFSYVRKGYGSGAYGKFINNNTQGTFYICLHNQYPHSQITVKIMALASLETTTYKDVEHDRTKIVPKYVKLTKSRRNISSRQVRVPAE